MRTHKREPCANTEHEGTVSPDGASRFALRLEQKQGASEGAACAKESITITSARPKKCSTEERRRIRELRHGKMRGRITSEARLTARGLVTGERAEKKRRIKGDSQLARVKVFKTRPRPIEGKRSPKKGYRGGRQGTIEAVQKAGNRHTPAHTPVMGERKERKT